MTSRGCAPSANRVPNSLQRWVTANDITPYSPVAARTIASSAKLEKTPMIT